MEAPPLLDQDEGRPDGDRRRQDDQPRHESRGDVGDDEAEDGPSGGTGRPPDVPSLETHELQGALEPPEEWVVWVTGVSACAFHPSVVYAGQRPKNRGSAWAAATRKMQAPTTIMIFFFTSCSSLFIAM